MKHGEWNSDYVLYGERGSECVGRSKCARRSECVRHGERERVSVLEGV